MNSNQESQENTILGSYEKDKVKDEVKNKLKEYTEFKCLYNIPHISLRFKRNISLIIQERIEKNLNQNSKKNNYYSAQSPSINIYNLKSIVENVFSDYIKTHHINVEEEMKKFEKKLEERNKETNIRNKKRYGSEMQKRFISKKGKTNDESGNNRRSKKNSSISIIQEKRKKVLIEKEKDEIEILKENNDINNIIKEKKINIDSDKYIINYSSKTEKYINRIKPNYENKRKKRFSINFNDNKDNDENKENKVNNKNNEIIVDVVKVKKREENQINEVKEKVKKIPYIYPNKRRSKYINPIENKNKDEYKKTNINLVKDEKYEKIKKENKEEIKIEIKKENKSERISVNDKIKEKIERIPLRKIRNGLNIIINKRKNSEIKIRFKNIEDIYDNKINRKNNRQLTYKNDKNNLEINDINVDTGIGRNYNLKQIKKKNNHIHHHYLHYKKPKTIIKIINMENFSIIQNVK